MTKHKMDKYLNVKLFYFCVLFSMGVLFLFMYFGSVSEGISGQPRSGSIPIDWVPSIWLYLLYSFSIICLLFVPSHPIIGVMVYLNLSYLIPIHTPAWIYTQWVGIRTGIAVFTFWGAIINHPNKVISGFNLSSPIYRIFLFFLSWYAFSMLTAIIRREYITPPLQFHPILIVEAFILFTAMCWEKHSKKILLLIATVMAATLMFRICLIQTHFYRDGDIASYLTMSLPLFFCSFLCVKKIRYKLLWIMLSVSDLFFILTIQNRGAIIGIIMILIGFFITSKRKRISLILGLPALGGFFYWFLASGYGKRFVGIIYNLDNALLNNSRILTWKAGLSMGLENIVFGVGPGNFLFRIGEYQSKLALHSAHNIFVDTFAETGFLGFLLFSSLILCVLFQTRKFINIEECPASRAVFISIFAFIGIGSFLSHTMMVLPYILFAIPVIKSNKQLLS